uniref:Putative secreted protein n=1 Tax=Ixodes ricinus TaxID=34613 RepID=A0A6B0UG46_IXORI
MKTAFALCLVVWTFLETEHTFHLISSFMRVDLPTFGSPTIATRRSLGLSGWTGSSDFMYWYSANVLGTILSGLHAESTAEMLDFPRHGKSSHLPGFSAYELRTL